MKRIAGDAAAGLEMQRSADRGAATIFALSSGRLPAAIAIVRCSGPDAHRVAERIGGPLPAPRQAALRALLDPRNGRLLDTALVIRFDGPASSTGEDLVEFHCHGGRAVVDSLLDALSSLDGLRLAEPGEFTRRAFVSGRIDLTEAEGLADLLLAETETQRRAALVMAGGALRRQIEQWRGRLVTLSAEVELAIDYADEEEAQVHSTAPLEEACIALASELSNWLAKPRVELLNRGVRVVVAGPANSGKSSLVNALSGAHRVIVSSLAGTTRDVVEVPLVIGGVAFVLVDTAGDRDTKEEIEAIGVALARAQTVLADILLWLGPADAAPQHDQRLIIHSKADVEPGGENADIRVSSVTGVGLDDLRAEIARQARSLLPQEEATVINLRQANRIAEARDALASSGTTELVLLAERLRLARLAFDRLSGRAGMEDLLDDLFGRFCLGK